MDEQLRQLEQLLERQIQLQDGLNSLMRKHRDAISAADGHAISELVKLQHQVFQAFAQVEKQRLQLVADLTIALQPRATRPLSLDDLATQLRQPWRDKFRLLRHNLREKAVQGRELAQANQRVSETLARGMQNVVKQVVAAVQGTNSYGRGPQPKAQLATFSATA